MGGTARAFLSNRYRRIDNMEIAKVVLPLIGRMTDAHFESCQITDSRMYIKVVNRRLAAEVVKGDIVQAGIINSNSEVGQGSVSIQPLVYRLVCSNGMIVNDARARKYHTGRVNTLDENFQLYSEETLAAEDHAFVKKIEDTVKAAVEEARLAQAGRQAFQIHIALDFTMVLLAFPVGMILLNYIRIRHDGRLSGSIPGSKWDNTADCLRRIMKIS